MPPLRQSTQEIMACPKFYVESMIKGRKMPSGMDSARGTEIHKTMAAYLSHCARKSIGSDLEAFDHFSRGAGPQAAKILVGLRDGFVVDHEHLLATEIKMALDEFFHPTSVAEELQGIATDSGLESAYEGTLDGIYVFREEQRIQIDDFKSHVRPFEPEEKPQSKEYALFIFQHFPWVKIVVFRLIFVRYRNLTREVAYTRDNIPALIDAVRSARARQQMLHDDYDAGRDIDAIPGAHCPYCPLLANRECPIAEFNYEMQLTMIDRLKYAIWYSAFSRVNNQVLKDHTNATGRKVVLKDYNGKVYIYGPVEKESHAYPLFKASPQGGLLRDHHGHPILPIIDLLLEHVNMNPDDVDWLLKLVISATKLESALGAKKRVIIHQAVTDTADAVTKVSLKISKPLDSLPEDDEDEFDEDEGGEF